MFGKEETPIDRFSYYIAFQKGAQFQTRDRPKGIMFYLHFNPNALLQQENCKLSEINLFQKWSKNGLFPKGPLQRFHTF